MSSSLVWSSRERGGRRCASYSSAVKLKPFSLPISTINSKYCVCVVALLSRDFAASLVLMKSLNLAKFSVAKLSTSFEHRRRFATAVPSGQESPPQHNASRRRGGPHRRAGSSIER